MRQRMQDLEDQETKKGREGIKIRPEMIKRVDEPIPLERLQAIQDQETAVETEGEAATQPRPQPLSRRSSDPALSREVQQYSDKTFARVRTMDPPGTIEGRSIGIQEPTGRELRKAYTTAVAGSGTDHLKKRNAPIVGEPLARGKTRNFLYQHPANVEPNTSISPRPTIEHRPRRAI